MTPNEPVWADFSNPPPTGCTWPWAACHTALQSHKKYWKIKEMCYLYTFIHYIFDMRPKTTPLRSVWPVQAKGLGRHAPGPRSVKPSWPRSSHTQGLPVLTRPTNLPSGKEGPVLPCCLSPQGSSSAAISKLSASGSLPELNRRVNTRGTSSQG